MGYKVFITATDTDAGKTWVTSAAISSLLAQGVQAKALKPVACGLDDVGRNDDIEALLAAQKLAHAEQINRYRFAMPAAPSQAAAAEGVAVDPSALVQWCHDQSNSTETCLIEGIGGLMTPITDRWLVSDWIEAMTDYDVWLVVGCKLGAINQTLLTLAKFEQMNRSATRIFFNAANEKDNMRVDSTRRAVEPFLPADCDVSSIHYGKQPDILLRS